MSTLARAPRPATEVNRPKSDMVDPPLSLCPSDSRRAALSAIRLDSAENPLSPMLGSVGAVK